MLADIVDHVIGIDPDRDRITASLVEASTGGELATEAFETTRGGYERLVAWADRHTSRESRAWAVEGSGSYGSGACAHLGAAGEQVIEFSHPRTAATSDGAKTDALDARRAAREVLGRSDLAVPRARGRREALRALETTRRGAQTARTAAINELKALIVSAPVDLRDQLRGLTTAAQVAKCAAFRLPAAPLDELTATNRPCAASRGGSRPSPHEAADLQTSIRGLVEAVAPHLLRPARRAGPSPPRRSTSPGHTPDDAATKQPSDPPRRRRPTRSVLRAEHPPPPQPPRRPPTQPSAAHHRRHPQPLLPPHPGLHRQTNRRRQNPPRSPTLPQTLHRPPDLPPPPTPQNQHLTNIEASFPRRAHRFAVRGRDHHGLRQRSSPLLSTKAHDQGSDGHPPSAGAQAPSRLTAATASSVRLPRGVGMTRFGSAAAPRRRRPEPDQ